MFQIYETTFSDFWSHAWFRIVDCYFRKFVVYMYLSLFSDMENLK